MIETSDNKSDSDDQNYYEPIHSDLRGKKSVFNKSQQIHKKNATIPLRNNNFCAKID